MNQSLDNKIDALLNVSKITREEIRSYIICQYNLLNSISINEASINVNDEVELIKWLNRCGVIFPMRYEKHFKKEWFSQQRDKIDYIAWLPCLICTGDTPRNIFSIRVPPKSSQMSSLLRKEFKSLAGTANFVDKKSNYKKSDKICLKIIFVLNGSRDKDVDNMVKITLDAWKNVLFHDDISIDHLDLIKIKSKDTEEHIKLSIGTTSINNHHDVIFRGEAFRWQ